MRVDKTEINDRDDVNVVAEVPVKTQVLYATIRPHKGHILFEINPFTGSCIPAVYESIDVEIGVAVCVRKKVLKKDKHVYVSALNQKNALKQFFKKAKIQLEYIKEKYAQEAR